LLGFRLLDGVVDLAAVRFFAAFVIGISFGSGQPAGCTAEAPQKPLSRRGRIPERQKARRKHSTVALGSHRNASPFWIILLLSLAGNQMATLFRDLTAVLASATQSLRGHAHWTSVQWGVAVVSCNFTFTAHTEIIKNVSRPRTM
jgi:hypothetical protein